MDIWSAGCIFAELLAIYNGLRSSRLSAKQFLQLPEGAGPIQYFQELLKLVGPPPESFFDCCLTDVRFYLTVNYNCSDLLSGRGTLYSVLLFLFFCKKSGITKKQHKIIFGYQISKISVVT